MRCTKVATHRIWNLKTGEDLGLRCSGHARKFRVHEESWKVEKV